MQKELQVLVKELELAKQECELQARQIDQLRQAPQGYDLKDFSPK